MSESESLHLLLHEEEKIKGRRIASTLGYLPLTFDQAGAHIRARCLSLKDFISHYDKRKERFSHRNTGSVGISQKYHTFQRFHYMETVI